MGDGASRMTWFRKFWRRRAEEVDVDEEAARELLDPYHQRSSLQDDERILIAPGKVMENIAVAMERVDVDIATAISMEEDVVTTDELMNMVDELAMGPTLAVHVVNNAMRIMSARYPTDLVSRPLPPGYDLRQLTSMMMSDNVHDVAMRIFNRRTARGMDLAVDDVAEDLEPLDVPDQMTVFIALFCMFGTKVGAMKTATGIE